MKRKADGWLEQRFPWRQAWQRHMVQYVVPKNLNLWYVFGLLALLTLVNQLLSGFWLLFFYTPTVTGAFDSLQAIMRDVPFGWLARYMHSTGASIFFVVIYLHLFRGLLYGSYQAPRELVWLLGMALFMLLVMESCCGYLLPWGQLSYWAAQVMTSLLSVLPFGEAGMVWLRGDYRVSGVTLHRFFAMHVLGIPMVIVLCVLAHIKALRHVGSNNPSGLELSVRDKIPFHPHYTFKEANSALVFAIIFFAIVFFAPEMRGYFIDPQNNVPANPLVTPEHLVPLWYMAPFFAMLRAIPNKLLGVLTMLGAFGVLGALPWLDKSSSRSMRSKSCFSRLMLLFFVLSFVALAILGMQDETPARMWFARLAVCGYFAYPLLMPWYSRYERL